jgi:hypothetical protein
MVTEVVKSSDTDSAKMMRDLMGPNMVDQAIRTAISHCWMMLPEGKKTVAVLEREIRRIVDRALRDLKEDMEAFGITEPERPARKSKNR